MFCYLYDEKGVTLVITMIVLLLMTLLGAGLVTSAVIENQIIHSLEDQKQAFYLAQAGIEYARCRLQQDLTYRTTSYVGNLGIGQFDLSVAEDGTNQVRIISTGKVSGNTRTLEVGAKYNPATGELIVHELAEYSMLSGGTLTFENRAELFGNGDLRSNGNIIFAGQVTVGTGEFIASGQVNTNQIPADKLAQGQPHYAMPSVNWESLKQQAISTGRHLLTWNSNLFLNDQINYIDASVISSEAVELTLNGIIVVKGNLNIDAKVTIKSDKGLMILVDGSVSFSNLTNIAAAIYATGPMHFRNNTTITGALYSQKSITCSNHIKITSDSRPLYQTILQETFAPDDPGDHFDKSLTFIYWKEI